MFYDFNGRGMSVKMLETFVCFMPTDSFTNGPDLNCSRNAYFFFLLEYVRVVSWKRVCTQCSSCDIVRRGRAVDD